MSAASEESSGTDTCSDSSGDGGKGESLDPDGFGDDAGADDGGDQIRIQSRDDLPRTFRLRYVDVYLRRRSVEQSINSNDVLRFVEKRRSRVCVRL
jgi:hypothetical protein